MSLKVYDADQVSISLAGIPISSGFADGEFLRIEQEGDDFVDVVGTDGEVSRSKTRDRRATITVLLMQTSDSNALLSALNNLDILAPNGAGVGTLLVRDRQGTSIYRADECWIQKSPDVSFDREATSREWTLRCANLQRLDGGN
jgi:hypothetical protein